MELGYKRTMTETKDQVFDELRKYLRENPNVDVKPDMDALIALLPDANLPTRMQTAAASTARNAASTDLVNALAKLQFVESMPKISTGDSFSRYCEKYVDYIYITKKEDDNLYRHFLSLMTDELYETLNPVELTDEQKCDAELFTIQYKKAIYGDSSVYLKNEALDCKQEAMEDISKFAFRLKEKCSTAFADTKQAEETCFLAFLRGIRNKELKRKINEAELKSFNEAVKFAKKLESIDKMMEEQEPITTLEGLQAGTGAREIRSRSDSPYPYQKSVAFRDDEKGATAWKTSYNSGRHRSRTPDRWTSRDYQNERWSDRSRTPERWTSRDYGNSYNRTRYRSRTPERWGRHRSRTPDYRRGRSRTPEFRRGRSRTPSRNRSRTPENRGRSRTPDHRRSRTPTRSGRGDKACYTCGSKYHLARQCDKNNKACYTCGKFSHIAKNCYLNQPQDTDSEN